MSCLSTKQQKNSLYENFLGDKKFEEPPHLGAVRRSDGLMLKKQYGHFLVPILSNMDLESEL